MLLEVVERRSMLTPQAPLAPKRGKWQVARRRMGSWARTSLCTSASRGLLKT